MSQNKTAIQKQAMDIIVYLKNVDTETMDEGILLTDSAQKLFYSVHDTCGLIQTKTIRAGYLDGLGKPDEAIADLLSAMAIFSGKCDSTFLIECYVNLSSSYLSLGDFPRVDSLCNVGLGFWSNHFSNVERRFALFNNKAISLANMGRLKDADNAFRNVLNESLKLGIDHTAEDAWINIGALFAIAGQLDSASYYTNLALTSAQRRDSYEAIMSIKINLAGLQKDAGHLEKAIGILQEAKGDAYNHNDLQNRILILNLLSDTYSKLGDFKNAFSYRSAAMLAKDSVVDIERMKSTAEMQEKYETVEKAKQIQELKVKNLDSELQTERVKRTRNAMYAGAGLLLIALFFIINRFRIMRRNRNQLREKNVIIEYERKRSEELLLNILPEEIAEELKQKGEAEAKHIDQVTVLFTDFKGFTSMAENSSARELVKDIHECFSAFDNIMEKYNIEKIKTIGDAYMAAGGLPTPNETHAMDVVNAALEICQFIEEGKQRKISMGRPYFEIRVGIHTGPVVAGIVGVKKFAYDIWGDTVNTASRMESSGEVGKVNISEATYEFVKESTVLNFEHRGMISAKNKGEMSMYFVSRKPN